jgi:dihydroneopterin aldolase
MSSGPDKPAGIVRLCNATFFARHGVSKEERLIGGRFEVDVTMQVDFREAAATDDLTKTVDYESVYATVRGIIEGSSYLLIERLAHDIAQAILDQQTLALSVDVSVRKINPPVGGPCAYAEALYNVVRS